MLSKAIAFLIGTVTNNAFYNPISNKFKIGTVHFI